MKLSKLTALFLGMLVASGGAVAQNYPNQAVRIVVPFPPGGLVDILARGLANQLSIDWKQSVIVDNRAGANTIIAAEAVARAAPDGNTILMATEVTIVGNKYLFKTLSYDPDRDFTPVINLVESNQVLIASPKVNAATFPEFIALAKEKPGTMNYGSFGLGSTIHLDLAAIASDTGMKMEHVPFKGIAEVLPALMANDVQLTLSAIPPALELIKTGRVRALAYAGPTRSALLPNVPTFNELGYPSLKSRSWFGLVVPSKTPSAVVNKIAADASRVMKDPAFIDKYVNGVGLSPLNSNEAEFRKTIEMENQTFSRRVKIANFQMQ